MYGKIFDSMYGGTLYGHWKAIVTFQQMIVLADADGIVDMTAQAIAARTSIPLEIIQEGIPVLEAPDPYSRTPGNEGKRIELIDAHRPWGWHIINHEKYKNLRDSDEVRAENRERQQRHREKQRAQSSPVTPSNALSQPVTDGNAESRHTDTYTDTDTPKSPPSPPLRKGGRSASQEKPKTNGAWWESEEATLQRGREVGITARGGEGWPEFRARIRAAIAKETT